MDQVTLAYVNLYAVLGALTRLCELDAEAAEIIKTKKPMRLGFWVKNGPDATLTFEQGTCTFTEGVENCDIYLYFSSPERFNGMIDGTVTPIPRKGLHHIFFLLRRFTKLTAILEKYLKEPGAKDADDLAIKTELMFRVIVQAVAQIANHDAIGMFSASNIVDGDIELSIAGGPAATLTVRDHTLTPAFQKPEKPRAIMRFSSMQLAKDLFDGKVNAVACIGRGEIEMRGMISMIDNVNRMMDRVSIYLAQEAEK